MGGCEPRSHVVPVVHELATLALLDPLVHRRREPDDERERRSPSFSSNEAGGGVDVGERPPRSRRTPVTDGKLGRGDVLHGHVRLDAELRREPVRTPRGSSRRRRSRTGEAPGPSCLALANARRDDVEVRVGAEVCAARDTRPHRRASRGALQRLRSACSGEIAVDACMPEDAMELRAVRRRAGPPRPSKCLRVHEHRLGARSGRDSRTRAPFLSLRRLPGVDDSRPCPNGLTTSGPEASARRPSSRRAGGSGSGRRPVGRSARDRRGAGGHAESAGRAATFSSRVEILETGGTTRPSSSPPRAGLTAAGRGRAPRGRAPASRVAPAGRKLARLFASPTPRGCATRQPRPSPRPFSVRTPRTSVAAELHELPAFRVVARAKTASDRTAARSIACPEPAMSVMAQRLPSPCIRRRAAAGSPIQGRGRPIHGRSTPHAAARLCHCHRPRVHLPAACSGPSRGSRISSDLRDCRGSRGARRGARGPCSTTFPPPRPASPAAGAPPCSRGSGLSLCPEKEAERLAVTNRGSCLACTISSGPLGISFLHHRLVRRREPRRRASRLGGRLAAERAAVCGCAGSRRFADGFDHEREADLLARGNAASSAEPG